MSSNVVFLKFSNPKDTKTQTASVVACKNCKNKTFILVYEENESFPMLKCTACTAHLGHIGWASEEN